MKFCYLVSPPSNRLFSSLLAASMLWGLGAIKSFSAEDHEYLPSAEGMEWIMDLKVFTPDRKKLEGTGHRKVEGPIQRDGKTYRRSHTWTEGIEPAVSYTKLTRKDSNGFYTISEREPGGAEQMEIPLPFKVGSKWETKVGEMVLQNTVVAVEAVVAGSKTYEDCFHIRIQSPDGKYIEDFWEAPRVGCVKSITRYINGLTIALTFREFIAPKTPSP